MRPPLSPPALDDLLGAARRRRMLRAGLIFLTLAAGLTVAWVAAYGQQRTPGVGLPVPDSIPAEWRSGWCPQVRPKPPGSDSWASPATLAAMQAAGWDWRARCPAGWSGWFAEWFPRTTDALRGGWETDRWGTRNTHTGAYTLREFEWAEVFWDKCGGEYRSLWWEHSADGGSREHPYTITPAGSAAHADLVEQARAAGAWPAFGETAAWSGGPAPCRGWLFWLRNEVGDAGPAPTPTPTATPPPQVSTPTPTPTPTATPVPCPPACPCVSPPPVVLEWLREVADWSGLTRMSAKRRRQADEALAAMERYEPCRCSTGRLATCLAQP